MLGIKCQEISWVKIELSDFHENWQIILKKQKIRCE